MLSLVRFLERPALWADLKEGVPISMSHSLELLIEVGQKKGKGTSCYQVEFSGQDSLARIVAAYISSQVALKDLHLGVMPIEELSKLGVSLERTDAPSVADPEIGQTCHFDLDVKSIEGAIGVAEILRANVISVPRAKVQKLLFQAISAGHIKIPKMQEKLVVSLAKAGHFALHPTSLS